jgi:amino-acid N-acetyltransferase
MGASIRTAIDADAETLHGLISKHQAEGRLLPRSLDEVRRHAGRFVVYETGGQIRACAELAPLSSTVAEVRSLVVAPAYRGNGAAAALVNEIAIRASAAGFDTLCAFTHDARLFVRRDFSIVPHAWVPEKIMKDCLNCPLFQRCGQYALVRSLEPASQVWSTQPAAQHAAVA